MMRDTRVRKTLRDVWLHRARSALVVAALALGLGAAGTLLNTWALVQRATAQGFLGSLPVSATLTVEGLETSSLIPTLDALRALPELAAVRMRRTVQASVQTQGRWRPALLFVLDDFTRADIARLQPLGGDWPPRDGTLIIERSSLEFSGATLGEAALLRWGRETAQSMAVAGVVRDVSLAPGWMENLVYGFVTPATLAQLGAPSSLNQLQFRVRDAGASRDAVRQVARTVSALLERAGARVSVVEVPVPGEHMHAAQMDSLMLTQAAFALLALLASGLLVINLVAATLAAQVREIGVMKVLGASRCQLATIYLGQAVLVGGAATLLAMPAALWAGRQYAAFKGELLNLPVAGHHIPAWALCLQAAVGLLLPVFAAWWPVRRACRLTVGQALRDVGIVAPGRALWLRRAWVPAGWARPMLLSLGNALRRRQRTGLTVLGLAVAGAVCLGAANLRQAVQGSVDLLFSAQHYDVSLRLSEPAPAAALEAAALGVEGVVRAEAWRGKRASLQGAGGEAFNLIGLTPNGGLLKPAMLQGRWLQAGDDDGLVPNRGLLRQHPGLKVGDVLTLSIDGQARPWRVLGLVDTGPQALAYTSRAALDRLLGNTLASSVQVAMSASSAALQLETVQRLRAALQEAGLPVASSQMKREGRRVVEDHLLMVVDFLGAMAWVMLAVGGMGLASTMGLAVLERTREIGVMRALGARSRDIAAIVQLEGLVIVALAWLLALPLSVLASVQLADAFGRVMFTVPTRYLPAPGTAATWTAVMLLLSLLACAAAALRATRVPPARSLMYE